MDTFLQDNLWLLALIIIWSLSWKEYTMWYAAQLKHKWWFITLLVTIIVNSMAIVDIIYIFGVAKPAKKKMGGNQGNQP